MQQPKAEVVMCLSRDEELATVLTAACAEAGCAGWHVHRVPLQQLQRGTAVGPAARPFLAVVNCSDKEGEEDSCLGMLAELRSACRATFVLAVDGRLGTDPEFRMRCFDAGAMMVAPDLGCAPSLLRRLWSQRTRQGGGGTAAEAEGCWCSAAGGSGDGGGGGGGSEGDPVRPRLYVCPRCGLDQLTEEGLHTHDSLYHSADSNQAAVCPVCERRCPAHGHRNYACHLHNHHGPLGAREPSCPDYAAFSWVVCQREDGQFLMVHEPAGICRSGRPGYWLPAGRVDDGESFVEAAVREAEEEAGVAVEVTGLLRCGLSGGTPRIVLYARPRGGGGGGEGGVPKSIPDFESVGAMWVDHERLAALGRGDYRAPDPAELFPAVATGALTPHPLDTEAWREVEAATRAVTLVAHGAEGWEAASSRAAAAWEAMRRGYPAEIFRH
jgi:8-oxo-dGTP pyrophosphatase MutT (NUDIX family)